MSLTKLAEELRESAKGQKSVTLDAAILTAAELSPPAGLDALIGNAFKLKDKKLVLATTPEQVGQPTETQLTLKGSLSALGVNGAVESSAGKCANKPASKSAPACSRRLPTLNT
jgi:hypothetical protein